MTLRDALRILRARWITVVVVTVVAVALAVAYSLHATAKYAASTTIFITAVDITTGEQAFAASEFAQARTIAYTELINSESLATRTIKRLNLKTSPRDLTQQIHASATTGSVVITLSVTDPSRTNAKSLANELSTDLVQMVQDLETPANGSPPAAKAVVTQFADDASQISPQPTKTVLFGLIAGLLLGAMVALLRGRKDTGSEVARHSLGVGHGHGLGLPDTAEAVQHQGPTVQGTADEVVPSSVELP